MAPSIIVGVSFPEEAEAELARGLDGRTVTRAAGATSSNLVPESGDSPLDAEVVFGQPSVRALEASARVRWVHLTSAGYTRYAAPTIRSVLAARGVALTTSSSVYAEPCATHALALTLALLRRLDETMDEQRGARAWPSTVIRARSGVLAGARAVVLGYGAMGKRVADLLAAFGSEVVALRERPRGDEAVRVVTIGSLDDELARADVVIDTLPESPSTRGLLDRARVARMKSGAIFVNVGRGATVDQEAIADALESGRLGGAGLDVTDPEPLPAGHRLWSTPRCIVTPHAAGGRSDEHLRLVQHFLANLSRYERGEALVDRV